MKCLFVTAIEKELAEAKADLIKSVATVAGRATASLSVATTLRQILSVLQDILARLTAIENDLQKKKEVESGVRIDPLIFPLKDKDEWDHLLEKLKDSNYFTSMVLKFNFFSLFQSLKKTNF